LAARESPNASALRKLEISVTASRLAMALWEMRIHSGPGYRSYYTQRGVVVYLLLMGGDKSSQTRDIERALKMAKRIK